MLISVVIPFYNELSIIRHAVASVFAQSGLAATIDIEVSIGNDGPYSRDEIVEAIEPQHRQHVRVADNTGEKGPGNARNTAINLCSGDFIAFLDADDIWLPEKLAQQLEAFSTGASFVATGYRFRGKDVIIAPPKSVKKPLDVFWRQGIGTSTVMLSRALLADKRFRNFRFSQDIDFWYRVAQSRGFSYCGLDEPLAVYSTSGSTNNKFTQARSFWTVLRSNRVPPHRSIAILARYAIRGIVNHYLSCRS